MLISVASITEDSNVELITATGLSPIIFGRVLLLEGEKNLPMETTLE